MKIDEAIILKDVNLFDTNLISLLETNQIMYLNIDLKNPIYDIILVPKNEK